MQIRTVDGFETRTSSVLERRGASGYLPWGNSVPPDNSMLGGSAAGVQVTEKTAFQVAAVYGSADLISDAIATLPVKVLQVQEGKPAVEIPAPTVIAEPYSEISPIDFKVQGTSSLVLRGNFFGKTISRDARTLLPTQVMPMHPDRVKVRRKSDGTIEWRFNGEVLNPADVSVMRGLSMPGSILGLDPISALRNQFGLAHAEDLFAGAFFSNSAMAQGVISVKGDLEKDEAVRMKQDWLESHQGINRAFLPAVLTGDATWTPITITPQNAQFLEQMQFSASVISGVIFRVPPHMLGMVDKDTSWGAGIEQQETGFVTNCLLGKIRRWELLMSSWLPVTQVAMIDLSHRLRGDSLQRWSTYQIGRITGAMNNAEIRAAEGMPVVDDPALNDYAAPLNSAPVKPTATGGAGGDKAN